MDQKCKKLFRGQTALLILVCLSLLLLLSPIAYASDVITSMNDLPSIKEQSNSQIVDLENSVKTYSILKLLAQDQQSDPTPEVSEEIVILYAEEGENNIGTLNLNRDDFSAGDTITEQVDVLETSGLTDTQTLISEISALDGVLAVSPNINLETFADPNDEFYSYQYYLPQIGAASLWNQGGTNLTKVAVIDSGINWNHEDLVGQIDKSSSFDFSGTNFSAPLDPGEHGTSVAGVICATSNNRIGLSGVIGKSNVKVVNYRVSTPDDKIPLANVVAAISKVAASSDIRVANLSLGTDSNVSVLEAACDLAASRNKVLVCGSGNDERSTLYYPAAYSSTIAVGAVDASNVRCNPSMWGKGGGSTYGPGLDLVAPGNRIATVDPNSNDEYIFMYGTSFSSPMVSAAAAILISKRPDLTADQVRTLLTSTARDLGASGYDIEYGYGLLQIDKAVAQLKNVSVNSPSDSGDNSGSTANGLVTIYRMYNGGNGEHLYTTSNQEVSALRSGGWQYEGVGWYAPSTGTGVYRLYNAALQNHLYTTDLNEVRVLTSSQGWTIDFDGKPIFYSGGNVPIYRVYNANLRGLHHLTTDINEYRTLPAYGWAQEGISFYAQKVGK